MRSIEEERSNPDNHSQSNSSIFPDAFKPIIQFDRNNRPFYYNQHGYSTYCDLEGNPIEFDRTGNQVFYDNTGYPFYYTTKGQAFFYDKDFVAYDSNGYVVVHNLQGEVYQQSESAPLQISPPVNETETEMVKKQYHAAAEISEKQPSDVQINSTQEEKPDEWKIEE